MRIVSHTKHRDGGFSVKGWLTGQSGANPSLTQNCLFSQNLSVLSLAGAQKLRARAGLLAQFPRLDHDGRPQVMFAAINAG